MVVDSDFAIPTGLSSLRVSVPAVDDAGKNHQIIDLQGVRGVDCEDSPNAMARFCMPLSFTIEPRPGRSLSQPILIQVEGLAPGPVSPQLAPAVVERSARVEFREGMTLRVPMFLGEICRGVVCGSGLTCVQGECVSVDMPAGVAVIPPTRGSEFDAGRDVVTTDRALVRDVPTDIPTRIDVPNVDVPSRPTDVPTGWRDVPSDVPNPVCAPGGCPQLDAIAANIDFTCALTHAGRVACWGANEEGQLGRGFVTMRVGDGGGDPNPNYVRNVPSARAIVVGETHACLVTSPANSEFWCWGSNNQGALAVGNNRNPLLDAARVQNFNYMGPVSVTAGARSMYTLSPAGIVAWGDNSDMALGTANANPVVTMPSMVLADRRVDTISARGRGMCVTQLGSTSCVGENRGVRFGAGSPNGAIQRTITRLDANFDADQIFLGESYSCLIRQNAVKCWGENRASGVLGIIPAMGDPAVISEPQTVVFPGDPRIRTLALGGDFALGLSNDGTVYCWGSNVEGTCAFGAVAADGTITPERTRPRAIAFPPSFVAPTQMIAAGRSHACAVDSRSAIFCWGRNSRAQIGRSWSDDPRLRRWSVPVPVVLP